MDPSMIKLELIIIALVVAAVLVAMAGLYRWLRQVKKESDRISNQLVEEEVARSWASFIGDRLTGTSISAKIERQLIAADSPMSVGDFILMRIGIGVACLLIGWLISGYLIAGVMLSAIGLYVPVFYLRHQQNRRRRLFSDQLPDFLSLVIGSLRAGYGLMQALTVVQDEMPEPMSSEFARVLREVNLGYSIGEALDHLVERVQNEDLALVITSIHIQTEVGGNLAEVMETISNTIRERIKLHGEIRVVTTQQRTTALILSALPFIVGTILMLVNPEYVMRMFEPGLVLILPITAVLLVATGNLIMNRMMKIEV